MNAIIRRLPSVKELNEIYLGNDGRALPRACRRIVVNGPPGAFDEEELDGPTTVVVGDKWHLIYIGTSNQARQNTVMGAVGTLDLSAARASRLSPQDQTRDFHWE